MALSLVCPRGAIGFSIVAMVWAIPPAWLSLSQAVTEAWLAAGRLPPREAPEAVAAMIAWSSKTPPRRSRSVDPYDERGCHRPPWRAGWPAKILTRARGLAAAGIRRHQSRPEDVRGPGRRRSRRAQQPQPPQRHVWSPAAAGDRRGPAVNCAAAAPCAADGAISARSRNNPGIRSPDSWAKVCPGMRGSGRRRGGAARPDMTRRSSNWPAARASSWSS